MYSDSQAGSPNDFDPFYPTAMNGCPLDPPVYQTASQIPGGCWGCMTSDTSYPRPYPPPFRPTGDSYGHQTMMPTHHYAQSERAAPTDQGELSPGEYIDLSNPRVCFKVSHSLSSLF
ncbi:hypothetical protein ARMSODRAFT_763125 [Armillaria solidipes]|uniref:Uncharacterized protein n=1 Tax=Armillaria solidipes TaxID=1076256 RepID=A0A2H3C8R1_9AGAR|nr:hypothetical protein ARMSODRAFT_763125 [Armillaria solidipes]